MSTKKSNFLSIALFFANFFSVHSFALNPTPTKYQNLIYNELNLTNSKQYLIVYLTLKNERLCLSYCNSIPQCIYAYYYYEKSICYVCNQNAVSSIVKKKKNFNPNNVFYQKLDNYVLVSVPNYQTSSSPRVNLTTDYESAKKAEHTTTSYSITPTSCNQIYQQNISTANNSSLYFINSTIGPVKVYCDMNNLIEDKAITFFQNSILNSSYFTTDFFNSVYTNQSKLIFVYRLNSNHSQQFFSIIEQLDIYKNFSISLLVNPLNGDAAFFNNRARIQFQFLPTSITDVKSKTRGFKSNGIDISFTNCDTNNHNCFYFYEPSVYNQYDNASITFQLIKNWLNSCKPFSQTMSDLFFFDCG